jgi:5-methylthioadenosine/S-adenosylhomocysteine deaminase
MATAAGAATMGGAGTHGELQVGQRADITLLDATDPAWLPLNDGPRQLCYAATSRSVHTVVVDGRVVYAQGRCTRIDEGALREEIAEAAQAFRQLRLRRADPAPVLAPLRAMVRHAHAQSHLLQTVNRVGLR